MGSVLSLIFPAIILSAWPCLLLLSYTKFNTPTRFILQWLFVIPFVIITAAILFLIGSIIKYATFNVIPKQIKIYILSSIITHAFWQVALYAFEFWSNIRYVVSDENVHDDIFHLNSMLLCNHSASPFDWISFATLSDYLMRFDKSFVFMKRQFKFVPAIGWIGSLSNAISLDRNWEKDKLLISSLCNKFKSKNGDYKLVTPWMWCSYPEGTRFTTKKLIEAQNFAKERGYPVYNNILQPRVKGFSYLTHHLYDALSCIIDSTVIYRPNPPQPRDYFLNTRLCKFIHIHIRVYRKQSNKPFPKEIDELNQWLRDRWTEKDKIIEKMRNKQINYKILKRSPQKAISYYVAAAILINYLSMNLFFGFDYFSVTSLLMLIASIFPAVITSIEYSQKVKLE